MQAMLLAAGLGKRLRPLTLDLAKPVVPVLNEALIAIQLKLLLAAGFDHVVVNLHHKADSVRQAIEQSLPKGIEVAFSYEPRLLGTGGGIRTARRYFRYPNAPLFVMNADILFAPDIKRLLNSHQQNGAMASMVLRETPDPAQWGAVHLDETGHIVGMLERPAPAQSETRALMFTGSHLLSPRAVDRLPEEGCVVRQGYIPWLKSQERLSGIVDAGPWSDLGTPQRYLEANLDALDGGWPHLHPDLDAHGSLIHPSADIPQSARIRSCILAKNVSVDPQVELEECVVWPETRVRQSASRAILIPYQTLAI